MFKAFRKVKRNRGAAGIDKQSITMFEANLEENLMALMKDLKRRGAYNPLPLLRRYIPKSRTEQRPLGIPAVRDRVAQEVIRLLIERYFEPFFHNNSYGFRPKRNTKMAIEMIIELRRLGYRYVVDADIKGFFDNIPHQLIMNFIREKIADGNILDIIEKFLTSGVMEDGLFRPTDKGTPQGGIISPLLANIVLDALDKELALNGYTFVRYADDFIVLCKNAADCEKALAFVNDVIETKLGLKLSPEKTCITSFRKGFDFLGFHFYYNGVTIREKSVEKFKDNIRKNTIRSRNFDDEVIMKLNRIIRGFANYFAAEFSRVKWQFELLDAMIRRRLRCMKKKRISKLDNHRITNKYFQKRGLVSLCSLI